MTEPSIKKLGPYLIDGVVGRGGMGSVFSARHEQTGEKAAIKVLAPALSADEQFRDRFVAEIESLETLHHPHIVSLLGYGESDGHVYYAMELVEGSNLEQELASGRRFSWREVTQMGIDISRALKHAHDHGVIHRDLKPANLLLDKDDTVKLTDFGIAKLFGSSRVTYNGSVLGTADYMSPEQAAGEAVTPRCDLYSLGCVMYALLAGRPPFQGKTIAEVVHKVRYEQHIPVSRLAADVPRDLQQIIDELLEKDPDQRIRTALSLTHRLRSIQQALSISTTAEDDFSSDSSADIKQDDRTHRIVNPPPDIAERPTVLLPNDAIPPTTPNTIRHRDQDRAKQRKRKLDHFTRVEMERVRPSEMSRANEYTSAVPLLLLLLTVLGGLLGGIWYSTLPITADELHARIMRAAEDPERLNSASSDVNRFLEKYPDDARVPGVQDLQEEIAINRLRTTLEVRARGRQETGKLSPIEVHCNEAFLRYREGDIEAAIQILEGVQLMFGEANQTDISIQRTLEVVNRLLPQWREDLSNEIKGLRANIAAYSQHARDLAEDDPETARKIWQGIIDLYSQRPWAQEFVAQARTELPKLPAAPQDDPPRSDDQSPEDLDDAWDGSSSDSVVESEETINTDPPVESSADDEPLAEESLPPTAQEIDTTETGATETGATETETTTPDATDSAASEPALRDTP